MPDRASELETEIARLRRELEEARAELERERVEHARLEEERARLRRENDRLRHELDLAQRAARRQAAPFSKGAPTTTPRPPGRRAARQHGRHGHRASPARVDEVVAVALPRQCPTCTGHVVLETVRPQYHEDLPVAPPVVRRFDVAVGRCMQCGRRVQGRHPLQTSDALGAAAVQLGPEALALIVVLNKQLGLSHGKIATLLRERFRLPVTSGAITRALHRVARHAAPTYTALCATVRGSPMVAPDETSWKVGGRLHWLWAFATPDTTVYAIQPGRGYRQAAAVLGRDYAGVLVRDGWAPYRRFQAAGHQTCLAHLLRRARDLRVAHPHARLPQRVQGILQRALALRDRRARLSAHGVAVVRGRLVAEFLRALDHPGRAPALQRFAAHLRTETPAIMSFLFDASLDATNWRAEQALRPAVVNRKVSGGNRSARGAETQQILTSVVRTATQRQLRPSDVLVDLLRTPTPIVAPALQ